MEKKGNQDHQASEALEHMQKLELKDGDVLVLGVSGRLSENQMDKIRYSSEFAVKHLGVDVKIMITEEGLQVGVLRKDDEAARLRKALADLVGATGKKDLEAMSKVLWEQPIPSDERTWMINAIQILIETEDLTCE